MDTRAAVAITIGPVVRVFVLGSGSSGNCLVVEVGGRAPRRRRGHGAHARDRERMRALGADLVTSRAPLGVFVTHDHGDHAAHALPIARAAPRAALRARRDPRARAPEPRLEVRSYAPGRPVPLGPFVVEALAIPHDAPHVALRVSAGRQALRRSRRTSGTRRASCARSSRACDLVFLESNYCPRLLETGPYPLRLKRRVAGPLGHLANDQTADLARSLEDTRVSRLVLVHLSRTNNSPERALDVGRLASAPPPRRGPAARRAAPLRRRRRCRPAGCRAARPGVLRQRASRLPARWTPRAPRRAREAPP